MKIAQIVSTFAPQLGGMGMVCAQEAQALVKAGHEVTVFTLNYNSKRDYTQHDTQFNFKIVRLKPLVRFGDAGLVPQIIKQIDKNFDLVHLHYPFYGGAEWLAFAKIPLVITYHMDAQVSGLKLMIEKVYNVIWPKLLFTKAKRVITIDERFNRSKLLNGVNSDKISVINNGIDIHIFKPQIADFDGLQLARLKDKKTILFVGNLLPLKRLDLLISAVQLLENKNVVLLVVGAGQKLPEYKQMVKKKNIESQVEFVGPCWSQARLAKYYNLATCVAVPSDYESFSLVAAEAMACGKPIVLSDLLEFKDKFSQAIFFEKGSAESLKNALATALSLPTAEARRISEWGRLKVANDFSFANHMAKLIEIYHQTLNF